MDDFVLTGLERALGQFFRCFLTTVSVLFRKSTSAANCCRCVKHAFDWNTLNCFVPPSHFVPVLAIICRRVYHMVSLTFCQIVITKFDCFIVILVVCLL